MVYTLSKLCNHRMDDVLTHVQVPNFNFLVLKTRPELSENKKGSIDPPSSFSSSPSSSSSSSPIISTTINPRDIMSKKNHVPKFGDWDSENISYTACFENARKDGVKRNPNDPEENPEAFKAMLDFQAAQPPYNGMSSSSTSRTLTNPKAEQTEGDAGHGAHRRKTSVGSRKSNTSESGSERSNSDYSLLHQQKSRHRRERSDRRKSSLASSGTGSDHSSMSHSQSKPKSTTSSHHSHSDLLSHDTHTRVASIPKFGDWDEKDPQSGEGFTYIFEQMKEEKKTASQFPNMPQQQPVNHLNSANKRGKSSSNSKSKSWCCLFWK